MLLSSQIRAKFIRMHDFCNLVSQSRVEQEEQNDWKRYLLKSRLEVRSSGEGSDELARRVYEVSTFEPDPLTSLAFLTP